MTLLIALLLLEHMELLDGVTCILTLVLWGASILGNAILHTEVTKSK